MITFVFVCIFYLVRLLFLLVMSHLLNLEYAFYLVCIAHSFVSSFYLMSSVISASLPVMWLARSQLLPSWQLNSFNSTRKGGNCDALQLEVARRRASRSELLTARFIMHQRTHSTIPQPLPTHMHSRTKFQQKTQHNPQLRYWWFNRFSQPVFQGKSVLRVDGSNYTRRI